MNWDLINKFIKVHNYKINSSTQYNLYNLAITKDAYVYTYVHTCMINAGNAIYILMHHSTGANTFVITSLSTCL